MRSVFGDILAALWLPVFSGTVAAAITWLVWYYAGGAGGAGQRGGQAVRQGGAGVLYHAGGAALQHPAFRHIHYADGRA